MRYKNTQNIDGWGAGFYRRYQPGPDPAVKKKTEKTERQPDPRV
jgi:hypothetical protein